MLRDENRAIGAETACSRGIPCPDDTAADHCDRARRQHENRLHDENRPIHAETTCPGGIPCPHDTAGANGLRLQPRRAGDRVDDPVTVTAASRSATDRA